MHPGGEWGGVRTARGGEAPPAEAKCHTAAPSSVQPRTHRRPSRRGVRCPPHTHTQNNPERADSERRRKEKPRIRGHTAGEHLGGPAGRRGPAWSQTCPPERLVTIGKRHKSAATTGTQLTRTTRSHQWLLLSFSGSLTVSPAHCGKVGG